MSHTLQSPLHEALRAFIVEKRKKAGLTQAEVAEKLGRYQSFVANIESGQRRIDVVELLDLASAIGFDPRDAIKRLSSIGSKAWRLKPQRCLLPIVSTKLRFNRRLMPVFLGTVLETSHTTVRAPALV
jgi:transcriptional regulator with XRE-family HTH domain